MVFAFAAITAINPIFGGRPNPGALYYGGVYVASPAVASFGAALPARALGAGWLRSLTVAAFFWVFFRAESGILVAITFALAPAVVTLAGSGNSITDEGIRAVLVAWAIFLFAAFAASALLGKDDEAFGFVVVILPSWAVLPAIAGLFQPSDPVA